MPSRKRHEPSDGPSSSKSSQKKTRFVSPEEDPARFAENVDAGLEDHPSVTKRGRVKTDGYDSDSTDDGEGVVRSRRSDAAATGGVDDDDDMFATEEKEEKDVGTGGKKKKEEYLRLGDIEGQEFTNDRASGSEEGSSASEAEDEPEDEDDAERRKKAGMGYELSSFNMRDEMEEGKFTEDGSYVRSFDPHAVHDKWMEGLDEREMKKARRAKRAQRRLEKERLKAESATEDGKEALEMQIVSMLKKGETVLEALARLGAKSKRIKDQEKKKPRQKDRSEVMELDGHIKHPTTATAQSTQVSQIDRLTSLASNLMALGDADIYDKSYEQLLRSIRSSGNVEPNWVPPSVKYEYRWDVPEAQGTGDQTFGPFDAEEMKAWHDAKYFGDAGEKVKVRVIGGEWGEWDHVLGD